MIVVSKIANVETKILDKTFSVFKLERDGDTDYGICFNSEIEDLKKGIYPKNGSIYHFVSKSTFEYYYESPICLCRGEDNKYLFTHYEEFVKNGVADGYFVYTDNYNIQTEYYNKLEKPFHLQVYTMLSTLIYDIESIRELAKENSNFRIYKENPLLAIPKLVYSVHYRSDKFKQAIEETDKVIDFVWTPDKENWDLFYKKYKSTDYDTAINFLIEDILKIKKHPVPKKWEVEEPRIYTMTFNSEISFYKYVFKLSGKEFPVEDICRTCELKDLIEDHIFPNSITTHYNYKSNEDEYSLIYIADKRILKYVERDVTYSFKSNQKRELLLKYSVSDMLSNYSYKQIDYNNIVFVEERVIKPEYTQFSNFYNYLTRYPLVVPVLFKVCPTNPICSEQYDLTEIKNILLQREDIVFRTGSEDCLNFIWHPKEEDWKKLWDNCLKDSWFLIQLPNPYRFAETKNYLQYIADKIFNLPKKQTL